MNLTEHFKAEEFGLTDQSDKRVLDNYTYLCEEILEPIRAYYGSSITINSGYRDPTHNLEVGGKKASWHQAENDKAACDFVVHRQPIREVDEWLRLLSKLPFDKEILECDKDDIARVIHIQVARYTAPRRLAYMGYTGDGHVYTPVLVA